MTSVKKTVWIIVAAVVFSALIRIPYYFLYPVHVDEASHAANTVTIMDGGIPYLDASANNKPPGIFYIYYATFLIFGKYSVLGIRLMAFLWTIVTAAILALLARQISGKAAALLAFAFYLVFTTVLYPSMLAANTEIFMVLPYSLAALLLWQAAVTGKNYWYFFSGVAAGLAPLIKQVGGVEIVAVALYLCALPLFYGKKQIPVVIKAGIGYLAGFLLPLAITVLVFIKYRMLDDALFWCLTYPSLYINTGAAQLSFWSQLLVEFLPFVGATLILWILGGLLLKRLLSASERADWQCPAFAIFLLAWLLVSIGATFTGSRMYGHYFIQILPPVTLLAALGGGYWFTSPVLPAASPNDKPRARWPRIAIIALTVLPGVVFAFMTYFADHGTGAWNQENEDFFQATAYIKSHTRPDDKIFVWGWFTPIYVYAERTPATRFVFTTMFTGYKPGHDPNEADRSDITWVATPEAWPMLKADLERNRPTMIIDTAPGNYHDFARYPLRDYPILRDYVDRNCHLETTITGMDIWRCRQK